MAFNLTRTRDARSDRYLKRPREYLQDIDHSPQSPSVEITFNTGILKARLIALIIEFDQPRLSVPEVLLARAPCKETGLTMWRSLTALRASIRSASMSSRGQHSNTRCCRQGLSSDRNSRLPPLKDSGLQPSQCPPHQRQAHQDRDVLKEASVHTCLQRAEGLCD